ncbi:MAG: hypothetical protein B6U97_01795 [Candidatus Altiarchaeales archaeon ex4484_96]|nr:MAG: hypothetical protein B6U97_01795 [Candidatus Altiarchaeales archaeon ex4484_96]
MAAKKKKKSEKKVSSNKTAKKPEAKTKAPTKTKKKDVIKIEQLPKSIIVEEDLKSMEEKTGSGSIGGAYTKKAPSFYRKYALKCMKCVNEFEHKTRIPFVKQKVKCPECGEIHIIELQPISGRYRIRLPKTLKVLDKKKNKKK